MIAIVFLGTRLLKLVYLLQGQKCNKEYFTNAILEGMNKECNRGAGCRIIKTMKIHMDNSRGHSAREKTEKVRKMKVTRLMHPSYLPNLNPCDFWLFGRAKTVLRNQIFVDSDDIVEMLANMFDSVTFGEPHRVFES
jgi:hypothetical protein